MVEVAGNYLKRHLDQLLSRPAEETLFMAVTPCPRPAMETLPNVVISGSSVPTLSQDEPCLLDTNDQS